MNWLVKFFTSSLGKKLVMSLTGLFLISFLLAHLAGNLQLLKGDGGEAFNIYADFMSTNPLIQGIAKGLYLFILIHTIQGFVLLSQNRKAKGKKYAVSSNQGGWASRNMGLLGTLILAFLFLHMGDFWWKIKSGVEHEMITYEGMSHAVKNVYEKVETSFRNPAIVLAYMIGLVALTFHLLHGFQSAFQTLGLNHKKYTPIIKGLGVAFSILVPAGFAIICLIMFIS